MKTILITLIQAKITENMNQDDGSYQLSRNVDKQYVTSGYIRVINIVTSHSMSHCQI